MRKETRVYTGRKRLRMLVVLFSEEKVHTEGVWDVGWFEVGYFDRVYIEWCH